MLPPAEAKLIVLGDKCVALYKKMNKLEITGNKGLMYYGFEIIVDIGKKINKINVARIIYQHTNSSTKSFE